MHAIAGLSAMIGVSTLFAADLRSASVVWSGVDEFGKGQVVNSMSDAVRTLGTAGKVSMPAVYLHPQNVQRSAVKYPKVSVDASEGTRIFLLTYAGIADGFAWDDPQHPADGVRFYVNVNGQDLVSAEVTESKWVPLAAQLSEAVSGRTRFEAEVSLQTDCGPKGNSNYDWAMFGEPLIVVLDGRTLRQGTPVSGSSGVVVAKVESGVGEIFVEGLDVEGRAIADAVARCSVDRTGLTFLSFDFGAVKTCVQWQWRADGLRVADAWGGSWGPVVQLTQCLPANAVTIAGDRLILRAGLTNTGKGALLPVHKGAVTCNGIVKPLEHLGPGESAAVEFDLGTAEAGSFRYETTASWEETRTSVSITAFIWPRPPRLPTTSPERAEARMIDDGYLLLQNRQVRWLLYTRGEVQGALVYVRTEGRWELVGSVTPWIRYCTATTGEWKVPAFNEWHIGTTDRAAEARAESRVERMVIGLRVLLSDEGYGPLVDVRSTALEDQPLTALWGPEVHVGDRNTGVKKGIAIFPGLEYLEGDERSSSTRDLAPPLNQRWTPHRFKITVPMMMVETRDNGPVMAIAWDPNQKWDGQHGQPAARFASPDFLNHRDSHLMQLGLPSVPEFIPENSDRAGEPVVLEAGHSWALTQHILAGTPKPDATSALEWFDHVIGYPEAEEPPRSFEEEIALCRHAFMKSVWDEETQTSLHFVGSGKSNAPGFATLMLMDARAVAEGEAQREVMDRVRLIAEKTLREQGPGGLASSAACHIMGWEFPYHWGNLPGALAGMKSAADTSVDTQEQDGGWGYYPDESRKMLGEAGTRVMGIAGRNAYILAKWVAISGDPAAMEALEAALQHMEQYRVPRGAQGWECPIMEPDVLASAYAVRAYVWAYMATGETKWLEKARLWARTGLPFQYAWDDGQRPGMRYASIPVFGSTYFTHSWLGLPVQWCGLVYAYALQELMRFDDNPLWRKQAQGITISAMHQQWPWDGPPGLVGTYPDSYGQWFTHRNGVFINPEDIQVNVLALHGLDPGLRSIPLQTKNGIIHVTAPCEVQARVNEDGLLVDLAYLPSQVVYFTAAPMRVRDETHLASNGEALAKQDDLRNEQTGWTINSELGILVVGVRTDTSGKAHVEMTGIERGLPAASRAARRWEFERDVEGWQAAHSCELRAEDGKLKMTVTGEDPYATSGPAAIPALRYSALAARVRLSAGSGVGLFWRASVSPNWGPDKEVHAACPADGQWHTISFDLKDHPLWRGRIMQVRLDIEGEAPPGTTLDVDWLRPEHR